MSTHSTCSVTEHLLKGHRPMLVPFLLVWLLMIAAYLTGRIGLERLS